VDAIIEIRSRHWKTRIVTSRPQTLDDIHEEWKIEQAKKGDPNLDKVVSEIEKARKASNEGFECRHGPVLPGPKVSHEDLNLRNHAAHSRVSQSVGLPERWWAEKLIEIFGLQEQAFVDKFINTCLVEALSRMNIGLFFENLVKAALDDSSPQFRWHVCRILEVCIERGRIEDLGSFVDLHVVEPLERTSSSKQEAKEMITKFVTSLVDFFESRSTVGATMVKKLRSWNFKRLH